MQAATAELAACATCDNHRCVAGWAGRQEHQPATAQPHCRHVVCGLPSTSSGVRFVGLVDMLAPTVSASRVRAIALYDIQLSSPHLLESGAHRAV